MKQEFGSTSWKYSNLGNPQSSLILLAQRVTWLLTSLRFRARFSVSCIDISIILWERSQVHAFYTSFSLILAHKKVSLLNLIKKPNKLKKPNKIPLTLRPATNPGTVNPLTSTLAQQYLFFQLKKTSKICNPKAYSNTTR